MKRPPPKINPRTLDTFEKVRLVVLGFVLACLAFYAWRTHRWYSDVGEVYAALRMEDSHAALIRLRDIDQQWGRTGEGYFLRARANRYLDDVAASELAIDQATAAGYNRPRLEHEQRLLEVQSILASIDQQTAETTLTSYQADLDENALALIRGYLRLGQTSAAERLLEAWKEQQGDTYRTRYVAGTIAMKYSKIEDAKTELEASYAAEPRYVPAWLVLGTVYWTSNEPAKAYEFFDRYTKARPDDLQGEGGRIETLLALGEYQKVADYFEAQRGQLDVNSQARLFLAKAQSGLDQHAAVVKTLTPLLEAWPQDIEANQLIAGAYQGLGESEKALEHANRAQTAMPLNQRIPELRAAIAEDYRNAAAHAELGHIFMHISSRIEGLDHLMTALSIDPGIIPAREDVARFYELAGDPQRAAEIRGVAAPETADDPGKQPAADGEPE